MSGDLYPATKMARGEAWKAYKKQTKGWLHGTKPKISEPVPLNDYAGMGMDLQSPPPPSKSPRPIPKSRTMGVLSTITHTFSRSSLSSSRSNNKSRNVSGSTLRDPTPAPVLPKHSFLSLARLKSRTTESDTKSYDNVEQENISPAKALPIPDDPRLVLQAMPPGYWSGRFVCLHDKARNQILVKQNLDIIIEVQASQRSARRNENHSTTPIIHPYNNPSTSIYATTRAPPPRSFDDGVHSRPLRIPQSVTTNDMHREDRSASYQVPVTPRFKQPQYTQPPLRLPEQPIPAQVLHHRHPRRDPQQCNSLNNAAQREYHPSAAAHDLAVAEAVLLTDDDRRIRLVLAELESLCATEDALRSFRAWQLEHARRTRRGESSPVRRTMDPPPPPQQQQQQQKRGLTGLFMGGGASAAGRRSMAGGQSHYSANTTGSSYVERQIPMPVPPSSSALPSNGRGTGEQGWRPRLRMSLSTTDTVSACSGKGEVDGQRRKRRIPGLF